MINAMLVRALYSTLCLLLLPFVFLRLAWRARAAPAYAKRWAERLGYMPPGLRPGGIWVHAVSVGEVLASQAVVQRFLTNYPDLVITVTTMTPTGAARVKACFGDRVQHIYLPYDLPWAAKRFLNAIQPVLAIIVETELWPNVIHQCDKRQIPVLIINARLSARSARGYQWIRWITQPMLAQLHRVIAQSTADAEQFRALGLADNQLVISGSVKFDIDTHPAEWAGADAIRAEMGQRPVWIAASTHAGEEIDVLEAHHQIRKTCPTALLLLVPRHPDRFDAVAKQCTQVGFRLARRSLAESARQVDVYLADTMGELKMLYAAADVAFVGGSLRPIGGHNILEPAAMRVPIVVGPHMFNFNEITQLMRDAQALVEVDSKHALGEVIPPLLYDETVRQQMVERASTVLNDNKGATDRLWAVIEETLSVSLLGSRSRPDIRQ